MRGRYMNRLLRSQRGITGLETAIILIAFVVVASVFAYTVLSAGIFSAEKGKEAVHSGLQTARSSMELVGSMKAVADTATELDDADTAWTAAANVTATTDTTDRKEGTGSADLLVDALFTTGLIASKDLGSTVDLTSHYTARVWIKSSLTLASGVINLVLDDTPGCLSATETLSVGALTANTWKQAHIKLADPSLLAAVACVGVSAASDPGEPTINVDFVQAPGEVDQIILVVANTLDGEPIDLTTTTDADSDGLLSDEATKNHKLSFEYIDKNQRVTDIAWTKTQRGRGDGDDLLEAGEKFEIQINLKALDPLPVENTEFAIHIRPENGSTVILEKRIPNSVDTVMDLN